MHVCLERSAPSSTACAFVSLYLDSQQPANSFCGRREIDALGGGGYFGAGLHEACVIPLVWNCLLV